MSIGTLGEAFNAGWRTTMRCTWRKAREGLKSVRERRYRQELDVETRLRSNEPAWHGQLKTANRSQLH
jgi:hypothetical protein